MPRIWKAVAVLAATAGCQVFGQTAGDAAFVRKAKEELTAQFKDPWSVRYRNLFLSRVDGRNTLCGEVNAKNAAGGYAGFLPFYFSSPTSFDIESEDRNRNFSYLYGLACSAKVRDVR